MFLVTIDPRINHAIKEAPCTVYLGKLHMISQDDITNISNLLKGIIPDKVMVFHNNGSRDEYSTLAHSPVEFEIVSQVDSGPRQTSKSREVDQHSGGGYFTCRSDVQMAAFFMHTPSGSRARVSYTSMTNRGGVCARGFWREATITLPSWVPHHVSFTGICSRYLLFFWTLPHYWIQTDCVILFQHKMQKWGEIVLLSYIKGWW